MMTKEFMSVRQHVLYLLVTVLVALLVSTHTTEAITTSTSFSGNTATQVGNGPTTYSMTPSTYKSGGGDNNSGIGGASKSQPKPCIVTVVPPVIELGTTTLNLSWTPTPAGNVNLSRGGMKFGGGTSKITVSKNSTSYTDTISVNKTGTFTYHLSFAKASTAQNQHGGKASTTRNPLGGGASLIEGVNQVALGVTSHGAATPGGAAGGYSGGTGNWGSGGGDFGGGGGGGGNSGFSSGGGGGGGAAGYACSVQVRVVTQITECNDGKDNGDSEDGLIDQQDPGCHTDGNPGNPGTYNPDDGSEGNPPADMKPFITAVNRASTRRPVAVTAGAENISGTYAASNKLVYGWRDTSAANWKPNCAKRGKNCFVENGKTYLRFPTFERAYAPGKRRTDKTRYFRPQVRGMYEVCAVADYGNIIKEGTSGEANNSTCRPIQVDDVDVPDDAGLTITGPVTLTADPALVRRGNTSGLSWDTGGRLVCEITGTNGSTIPVTSVTGVVPTVAITAQTTYTLSCTDVGYEGTDDATIRILPQLQEI